MGKSDYKKINENWDSEGGSRAALNNFYDEAAQNQSSTGKKRTKSKPKKANHKHLYEDCLITCDDWSNICIGKYCTVCGLKQIVQVSETEKNEKGYYTLLTNEEVIARHPDWPMLHKEKVFGKD